jgi:cytochrome c oxidase assembly protein subunit 15
MTWGAFVAGLRAGLLYNTFPTMNGHWLPPELLQYKGPLWKAFFEEPATVQFTHRVLALLTFGKIMLLLKKAGAKHPTGRPRLLFRALGVMAFAQVGLGIATLLSGVNIYLAVAHQAGALTVLTLLAWLLYEVPHIPYHKGPMGRVDPE